MMNRVSVEASFFKKLRAYENLIYGSKLYGVSEFKGEAEDQRDPAGHRVRSETRQRADGESFARHAAEDRARPGAPDQSDAHAA